MIPSAIARTTASLTCLVLVTWAILGESVDFSQAGSEPVSLTFAAAVALFMCLGLALTVEYAQVPSRDSPTNRRPLCGLTHYSGIVACSLMIIALLIGLNLSYILQTLTSLLGIALRVYFLSVFADVLHSRIRQGRMIHPLASLLAAAVTVLLFFSCYALVSSIFALTPEQLQVVIPIGLAITYFNLGAAVSSGSLPLDLGLTLPDGRRLLGDGKTVQGSSGGLLISFLVSIASSGSLVGLIVAPLTMLGDAIGSFVKRRIGLDRGSQVIFLDQFDCVLPLLVLQAGWHVFDISRMQLAVLVLATFLIQVYGNVCMFYAGKKSVPW